MFNRKLINILCLLAYLLTFNVWAANFNQVLDSKNTRSTFIKQIKPEITRFQEHETNPGWDVEYSNFVVSYWDNKGQSNSSMLKQMLRWSSEWNVSEIKLKKVKPTLSYLLKGFNGTEGDITEDKALSEMEVWDVLFNSYDDEDYAHELAFFLDVLKSKIKSIKHLEFYVFDYFGNDHGDFVSTGWLILNKKTSEVIVAQSMWTE